VTRVCGRFTLTADLDFLVERFQIAYPVAFEYKPRYNIAPSQDVPAVIRGERGNKLGTLRWGLVPFWAKDPSVGYKMINARSETAATKPSFREALRTKRCLILADGFYEWKKEGQRKQPYRIFLKGGKPFAFAGLWSVWEKGDVRLATCTILTTTANALLADLHDRMPVILPEEAEDVWLDPLASFDDIRALLKRYPADAMDYYPVSDAVNSPKNDDRTLIEPLG
jgi:putative SOS response-associated peptidase YedK